jgi:cytochrome c oxidase subunit 4
MSHAAEFDEYGHKDHGHVIVSLFTLRFVLAALLVCTLATSGAAWAENTISEVFHVEIPQWINAAVALSIAIVKTTLVVMFFMQLKYDNPMNTIIFVFTILTVFSFLGFTSLDLNNRDTIDRFKNQYAYDGGDLMMGGAIHQMKEIPGETKEQKAEREKNFHADNPGESIVDRAKRVAREKGTYDPHHEHHAEEGQSITDMGYLPEERKNAEGERLSTSNISRPVKGVTIPGLPGYRAPKSEGEGAPAGESKPGEKSEQKTEAEPKALEKGASKEEPPKPR